MGVKNATRVLHVLPSDNSRGAQVYARALCDELGGVDAGHRVVVIFDGPRLAAQPDDELRVPRSGSRPLALDPRAASRLWKLVRRTRPEIVLGHGPETFKHIAPLAAMPGRPRLVGYAVGVALPKAHRPAVRAAYAALFHTLDVVAGVSHEVVDDCRSVFRVPPERLVYVPNGRALPPDPPAQPNGASGSRRDAATLAFVGHLTASKRPGLFLEVVAAMRATGFDGRAWMAGEGPLLDEMRRRAGAAGVDVLGRRDDVAQLLPTADVMCFTSVPEGEGMPGVLIEAGFAGVPVVSTEVPGARTVIDDGATGFVVAVDDRDGFVAAVARLLADPQQRERMGSAARARCSKEFTLAASAQRWREVFARVTGTPVQSWT